MNQALDIIGSYLIGGIVVAALAGLTFHITSKSQETTLSQITQYTVAETGKVIEDDISKAGYRVASGPKILAISADSIAFRADLSNHGTIDTVKYYSQTVNNTKRLFKKIGNSIKWSMPVERFGVAGLDSAGSMTNVLSDVKSITVSIVTQETTDSDSQNIVGAFWKRQIFPKNL